MKDIIISLLKACARCRDKPCLVDCYSCQRLEKALKQLEELQNK